MANVRPGSSLMEGSCLKGFDSWAASMEKTEASLTLASPSSSNKGQLVACNGVLQCGHNRRREGGDWGGGRIPALLALGHSQGWKHFLLFDH